MAQSSSNDVLYDLKQLERAMSNPSTAHIGAAKHLLRCLASDSVNFDIADKQGGLKLTAFSIPDWGASTRTTESRCHHMS